MLMSLLPSTYQHNMTWEPELNMSIVARITGDFRQHLLINNRTTSKLLCVEQPPWHLPRQGPLHKRTESPGSCTCSFFLTGVYY